MDTEILRPNALGDETNLTPSEWPNWECVGDDDYPYVYPSAATPWFRDLYNLPASVGQGTINKITLYFRVTTPWSDTRAKGAIKSNAIVTETAEKDPYTDFGGNILGTYAQEWDTNPATGLAWTWADIDALQIGVALLGGEYYEYVHCTQVYVEVDYTPPAVGCLPVIGAGILLVAGIIAGIIALV